jgi:hypothetical protein
VKFREEAAQGEGSSAGITSGEESGHEELGQIQESLHQTDIMACLLTEGVREGGWERGREGNRERGKARK